MSAHDLAEQRQRELQRLARRVEATGVAAWRELNTAAIAASWTELSPAVIAALIQAQQVAAAGADAYTGRVLSELNVDTDPAGRVVPSALSGLAADGRPLRSLLFAPVVVARSALGRGEPLTRALASGQASLRLILRTETMDAGRVADGVSVAARPKVGYVRQLTPPSCPRCAILAGKFYRFNQGFQRHPSCFPAGVVVSGPQFDGATRRWYEGELVVLATAGGEQLALTSNHPILTSRGWIPANLLNEGDDVVRSARTEGATALVVPDHHEMPSLIEDVWSSLAVGGLHRMPSAPEDFHGDGNCGQVDVVYADRTLLGDLNASVTEHTFEPHFASAIRASGELDVECMAMLLDLRRTAKSCGSIGGGGLSLTLSSGHIAGTEDSGFTCPASLDARLDQALADSSAAHSVLLAEREFTGSCLVGSHDVINRQITDLPRWDAPGDPFSVESCAGYASRGVDLLNRLSGQIELDRVVELRRVQWSGHVYSLTSVEGWHNANNLIVSNCDCIHIPSSESVAGDLTTDPRQMFEQGQIRGLSKADAKAIADGADMNQVVNAHRGMYTAGGRKFTTEGTTRRGIASRSRRLFGQNAPLETTSRSGRRTVRRIMRPRPEQIYRDATSRADATRLLRLYGYLG